MLVQERQRAETVALPAGAAEGSQDETRAESAAAAELPRDVVHPGLHGGAQDETSVRRLW